jgi:ribosomal protein S18 acetylase RimI-like enzyme
LNQDKFKIKKGMSELDECEKVEIKKTWKKCLSFSIKRVMRDHVFLYKMRKTSEILGFITYRQVIDDIWEITSVAVDPDFRNCKLGKLLVLEVQKDI